MTDTIYNTQSMIKETLSALDERRECDTAPLSEAVKAFAVSTWENGLADVVERDPNRGMIGSVSKDVSVLTYVMAGRILTTIHRKDDGGVLHAVSVMAGEEERPSRMGLHGMDGTVKQAIQLLDETAKAWKNGTLKMQPDVEVKLDVLC